MRISIAPSCNTTKPQKTSACSGPAIGSRRIFVCANPILSRLAMRLGIAFKRFSALPRLRKRSSRCALNEKTAAARIRMKRNTTFDVAIDYLREELPVRAFRCANGLSERRYDVEYVADDTIVGDLEDRSVLVAVDRHN